MFNRDGTGHGVIRSLAEAQQAAKDAKREGLLGYYPAACVVLDEALTAALSLLDGYARNAGVPEDGHCPRLTEQRQAAEQRVREFVASNAGVAAVAPAADQLLRAIVEAGEGGFVKLDWMSRFDGLKPEFKAALEAAKAHVSGVTAVAPGLRWQADMRESLDQATKHLQANRWAEGFQSVQDALGLLDAAGVPAATPDRRTQIIEGLAAQGLAICEGLELPDAIRVPLDELEADAPYLAARLANGTMAPSVGAEAIQKRTRAIREALLALGVKVCPGCKEEEPYCGCVTSGVPASDQSQQEKQ